MHCLGYYLSLPSGSLCASATPLSVRIPPLRDRPGDVDLLISALLPRLAAKAGKRITGVDPEVRSFLNRYDWPGNVRELVNVIEGAVCLASQPVITWKDIPPHIAERIKAGASSTESPSPGKAAACATPIIPVHLVDAAPSRLEELEKTAIEEALTSTKGNKRQAALLLGMARSTFYEKLKKYRLPTSNL